MARLPASSLQWGLAAGRTESLGVAAVKLAEVVQESEVVGLLQVRLLAGTLEHLEGVREGIGEGRRPGVDRETMHWWYKRAATLIGCDVSKWISHLCNMKKKKRKKTCKYNF